MTTATRPAGLLYAVDERPPLPHWLLLGLQYAVMDAIYLVLVVIVVKAAHVPHAIAVDVLSLSLVALAIATTLQALHGGPVGSGFLAPPVYSAIYLGPAVLAARAGGLPLVCGMTAFAAIVEIALGFTLRHLRVVFQPILSGLTVLVVGFQLGIVGIGQVLDVQHVALHDYGGHLVVTTLTLGTCVALSIWGRGAVRLLCTLAGLTAGIIAAIAVGLIGHVSLVQIDSTPLFQVPDPHFLSYSFQTDLVPSFLAAGLAATLRTIGVVTTCQRINDADWKRPDMGNIRKGIFADGLGCLVGGLLGAPGMNIAPSLVGISSATGATSRVVAYMASAFLLLFAFLPKVAAAFLVLPTEVAGALLVFTASFMITSGMQITLSRTPDTRAIYVIGISTLLALSKSVFPQFFAVLPPMARSLASSSLALGLSAAVVLTLIFRFGVRQRASLTFPAGAEMAASATAFIQDRARTWRVDPEAVENCRVSTEQVLGYMETHALHDGSVTLRASFDGLDLGLDILYQGREIPGSGIHLALHPALSHDDALQDEEAPAYVGLQNFLRHIHADRKRVSSHGQRVRISLRFAV